MIYRVHLRWQRRHYHVDVNAWSSEEAEELACRDFGCYTEILYTKKLEEDLGWTWRSP